jgi:hypothetical protein
MRVIEMKHKPKRLSHDGLPIDSRDWTEADWQDLHEAIERVKRNVSQRHRTKEDENDPRANEGSR